jgi:phosphonate transport system ATP-binding protein
VFDGVPAQLTEATARELYGLEAGEVMDEAPARPREDRIPAYGEAAVA